MSKRRICVVTGSRAEYGLLFWPIREIADDPDLDLQLVVTGMHLSDRFGHTVDAIEADGFDIDFRIETLDDDDGPLATARAVGRGVEAMAAALDRLEPDIVLLLGDRFEIFAAAQAALIVNIPIAHIHGGEITEGAFDESMRHAITKMAHLHFVSAEAYGRRVVQLGETPERVFLVGAPGLDNIRRLDPLDREALAAELGRDLSSPLFLITYHPVTLATAGQAPATRALIEALDAFPTANVLITGVNADPGRDVIARLLADTAADHPARISLHPSLGQQRYLSALKLADVVIGNSSSGIIEAPALRTPTVNIGDRQKGRLRAASVIDCGETADQITDAIARALDPDFRAALDWTSPYGDGHAAPAIVKHLKEATLDGILRKRFFDLPAAAIPPTPEQPKGTGP